MVQRIKTGMIADNAVTATKLDSTSTQLFGFRNRIINGAMVIDQRNAGASVTPADATGTYTLDRWRAYESTDGSINVQQDSSAPAGFTNSLKVTVATTDTSLGASQQSKIEQIVEGFNVADLGWGTANAKTVTLSFWVRSSVTGTFGGAIHNSVVDRSYPFTYSISSADTWEYKTVTIPGDTSGTWLKDNGAGMRIPFALGAGSNFSGTAGAWNSNNNVSATGATNLMATSGATWYITGVQLEVGSVATPFERRPYVMELQLCQRYYEKSFNTTTAPAENIGAAQGALSTGVYSTSANAMVATATFAVEKRAAPTITTFNPYAAGSGWSESGAANRTATLYGIGTRALTLRCDAATSAVGNNLLIHWTASIEL